jgi:hypothetical protein
VRAWAASDLYDVSLPDLLRRTRTKIQQQTLDKKHNTPGYFHAWLEAEVKFIQSSGDVHYSHDDAWDWGRFTDVGSHTHVSAPTTCWPLVMAALESLLTVRTKEGLVHAI